MSTSTKRVVAAVLVAATALQSVAGFYLPGMAPRDYARGERVPLLVNSLTAADSLVSYDYYYPQLHFCQPETNADGSGGPVAQREVIDGLPAAQLYEDRSTMEKFYAAGFDLGEIAPNNEAIVFNHHNIIIHYHMKNDKARVVGVLVQPARFVHVLLFYRSMHACMQSTLLDLTFSLATAPYQLSATKEVQDNGCDITKTSAKYVLKENAENQIQYTYSVFWVPDPISWGTRWDHYLHVFDPQIHWFSIVNSIVIVLILASMVTMILLRALHRDITRYNTIGDEDGAHEEYGWKMIHADVFRPPNYRMLLSVMVGNGAQLLFMATVTLVFAVLGFLSPSSRGALGTMALVFYILFSAVAGYTSAVLYKTLQGEHWRQNVLLTAVLVP
eukprot:jgi/Hompol1/2663/HPOL_006105-RA